MPEQVKPGSGVNEQALQSEIVRLNKIIQSLMNRTERNESLQGSDFNLFQTAITLEAQVRRRTDELEAARLETEKITRALRESEAKYRSLFEHSIEGIFQTTPEGRFISANPAQAKLLGYDSPQKLIKQTTDIPGQYYANPKDREIFKNTLEAKGIIEGFEVQLLKKDGNPLWVSMSARSIRNVEEAIIYYEGTMVDITERKRAEEERERLIVELQEALSKIKVLDGLLPTCSFCKKIRNDKGEWEQIEAYIRDRSKAEFSHSICPECMEKRYPEVNKKK